MICFECCVRIADERMVAGATETYLKVLAVVIAEQMRDRPGERVNRPEEPSCQDCQNRTRAFLERTST